MNQFSIDFVTIGNPGNGGDSWGQPNGVGGVNYVYNLGKHEISREMIEKANHMGGLSIGMYDMASLGGNGSSKPATGISWVEAAIFVNFLNSSKGFFPAYKINASGTFGLWAPSDLGYDPNNLYRNKLAKFWLPSRDEWYKAAYGDPLGGWRTYPLADPHEYPNSVSGGTSGLVYARTAQSGPADITNAGGLSAWGTMAQGGNVYEWMESARDRINDNPDENRELRGGAWYGSSTGPLARDSLTDGEPSNPSYNYLNNGFRVAMVPEPSSLSLFFASGIALSILRRRK